MKFIFLVSLVFVSFQVFAAGEVWTGSFYGNNFITKSYDDWGPALGTAYGPRSWLDPEIIDEKADWCFEGTQAKSTLPTPELRIRLFISSTSTRRDELAIAYVVEKLVEQTILNGLRLSTKGDTLLTQKGVQKFNEYCGPMVMSSVKSGIYAGFSQQIFVTPGEPVLALSYTFPADQAGISDLMLRRADLVAQYRQGARGYGYFRSSFVTEPNCTGLSEVDCIGLNILAVDAQTEPGHALDFGFTPTSDFTP